MCGLGCHTTAGAPPAQSDTPRRPRHNCALVVARSLCGSPKVLARRLARTHNSPDMPQFQTRAFHRINCMGTRPSEVRPLTDQTPIGRARAQAPTAHWLSQSARLRRSPSLSQSVELVPSLLCRYGQCGLCCAANTGIAPSPTSFPASTAGIVCS